MTNEASESAADEASNRVLKIGLLLHGRHAHTRTIALGAVEYHRENEAIRIEGEGFNPLISWDQLEQFSGDGLVAIVNSDAELERLRKSGIPFVLVGGRFLADDLYVVTSDNAKIGELSAEHLMSCGIKKFTLIGPVKWDDERLRYEGFRNALSRSNYECSHETVALGEGKIDAVEYGRETVERIVGIVERLPKPCGVFCPNAFFGRAVTRACQIANVRIPDEIAVMSANFDPILCETSEPPLSAVVPASTEIGFQGVEMICRLLRGEDVWPRHLLLPPRRLSVRRSTDLLKVGDETVERALRFMRDAARQPLEITAIAKEIGVSRRTLELKFRSVLQRTPRQELLRMRMDIAKSLLSESDIPISEIAVRSGFGSSQVFSSIFKKELGQTPTQYRGEARSRFSPEM